MKNTLKKRNCKLIMKRNDEKVRKQIKRRTQRKDKAWIVTPFSQQCQNSSESTALSSFSPISFPSPFQEQVEDLKVFQPKGLVSLHKIERFKTITFIHKVSLHSKLKESWPRTHVFTLFKEDQHMPFLKDQVFKTGLKDFEGLDREEDDHASDSDIVWGAQELLRASLNEAVLKQVFKRTKPSPTKSSTSDDSQKGNKKQKKEA
ncbi:hypothetical protein FGO68_gene4810 [Halteria grandinella]|uniref:Uncharacterized protein n=1 Tax=Halteria grandinella TaxID=5974 RepID=A0A8J8T0F8_HALGN|nr:hypothetical protein FGO68_gene4810 [Halteria grandinella]